MEDARLHGNLNAAEVLKRNGAIKNYGITSKDAPGDTIIFYN